MNAVPLPTTTLPSRAAAPARLRVLVVDDEPSMRMLIRRLVERDFDVDVAEADDGLSALDRILTEQVDLMLLDLSMRVIDGIETLECIRRSRTFAHLPVIVLTGQADEDRVRRAMLLGVRDVLAKPFTADALRERVSRMLRDHVDAPDAAEAAGPEVALSDRMLVVDADPEFRAMAARHFGRICAVETFDNEFAALARCLASPAEYLLIGSTSELTSTEGFARKVRKAADLGSVKLIAAVPASEVDAVRAQHLFDAVLVRSLRGFAFERSLRRAFGEETLARLVLHPESTCIHVCFDVIQAGLKQLFGRAIDAYDAPPRPMARTQWVVATAEIGIGQAAWEVRLRCPMAAALEIAAASLHTETDVLAEARMMSAVGRLVSTHAQQVRTALLERGLTSQPGLSCVNVLGALGALPDVTETLGARRWYLTPRDGIITIEIAPVPDGLR